MRPRTLFTPLVALAGLPLTTQGFEFRFYRGNDCRSEQLGLYVAGPGQDCTTMSAGAAKSVIVKSTGEIDSNFYAVFFSSEDCDPNTIVLHTDNDECHNVEYKSFKVWDVDEE
ncbi:hypothetical protein MGYG_06586 [Nannizzia gypsea CBS 118893]|uniref:Uncharacterized protein n=1 Tax=Arthroderma gypseum (strain ATCC MYA-4604 / CBS 118893) TaxID=535722 RepID=E4V2N0_ARTGP|nr:hypothetical protein MGYG_06586 [Nannizzia gypsea CBS 118893]EFR03592.1 hypothetical protein MGYG_06586 [Nannizzia gypsea CBS 118893]